MVAKNIKLIFQNLKLNLQKEAKYKTSFVMQIVMMILNNAFWIIQWIIIFSIKDNIGGYGFNEVMWLWALSAGSYGVSHLFFSGAYNLPEQIYHGKLDVFMTQPRNILINSSTSKTDVSAIGDVLYTFIALAVGQAPWWFYLAAIPLIMLGGLIMTSVCVFFSSMSFFVKSSSNLAHAINQSITMFNNYPPIIFTGFIKIILYTIIPVGFITFVPMQFVFQSFNVWWLLAMIGATIAWVLMAFGMFYWGLKKYNSGNLMVGRL